MVPVVCIWSERQGSVGGKRSSESSMGSQSQFIRDRIKEMSEDADYFWKTSLMCGLAFSVQIIYSRCASRSLKHAMETKRISEFSQSMPLRDTEVDRSTMQP